MSTSYFSSGTTDGKPKEVLYSQEDLINMEKGMKHNYEQCPSDGVVLNLLPAFGLTSRPHMAFQFMKIYEKFCPSNVVSTGGLRILNVEQTLDLMEEIKPQAIVSMEKTAKELILKSDSETLANLKNIICTNGLSVEGAEWFESQGFSPWATYGLTEARMAFLTEKNWKDGYVIHKDCGVEFKEEDGELVLYSENYPKGFKTGDLGTVEDFGDYQKIGFIIRRKNGTEKFEIGCTRQ
jgi:phenylacetate-coenzyme A ligase PaaK-like adenylate-forming protein